MCMHGPDDLAEAVLTARRHPDADGSFVADISDDGLRRLVRAAYYASQAPNEGRYPQLTLFVPAAEESVNAIVSFEDELTLDRLRRIAPALPPQDQALLVREEGTALRITGVIALRGVLTELSWGDPTAIPLRQPRGLLVQIAGPGELRAGEHHRHRLQAGSLAQEVS